MGGSQQVVVIGDGVIGLSIAAAIAERAHRVVVLTDGDGTDTPVSRASFGWVNAHGKAPEAYRVFSEQARTRHRAGTAGFMPTGAEAPGSAEDGWLDAARYLDAQRHRLRSAGGALRTGVRVVDITPGERPRVTDVAGRPFDVDRVVIAAGAATATLVATTGAPPGRIGTAAGAPGFCARFRVPDGVVPRIISTGGLQLRPDRPGLAAAQSLDIEARLATDSAAWTAESVWPALRAELRAKTGVRVPAESLVSIDVATRPMTVDARPVLGDIATGVSVAVTHSGFTLAPLIADLVAAELAGAVDPRVADYRP